MTRPDKDKIKYCIAVLPDKGGLELIVGTDGPMIYVLDARGQVISSIDTGSPLRKVIARATPAGTALYAIHRKDRVTMVELR